MNLLNRLSRIFSLNASVSSEERNYWLRARCDRCGEIIPVRIDLLNDLSRDFSTGHYFVRKVAMGDGGNRCFQRVEIELTFDSDKKLIEHQVTGGEILFDEEASEE
ncbi:MAG: hypothetical protein GXP42_14920 [Chloroflexi bacterium]|nr:hypothetical protein [Chloroflexota bacterium]